jgi:hypothetical protein
MTDPTTINLFARHRSKVRERFNYCSPFRLGIAVAESGESLASPYRAESRADRNYLAGIIEGRHRLTTKESRHD